MSTIYIKGTTPKNHPFPLISWLIRLFSWSDISHVLIDLQNTQLFHIQFNDKRYELLEPYEKTVHIRNVIRIDMPEEKYKKILKKCAMTQGRQKGFMLHLIGIAITVPFRLLGIQLPNMFASIFKSLTCSMFIHSILADILYLDKALNFKVERENITERDVVEILEASKGLNIGNTRITVIK